jgi:hypothetical protein
MKQNRVVLPLALLLAASFGPCAIQAQNPTAVQKLQLSAFGGVSGDYTGLGGGKNLSLTAGGDLALPIVFNRLRPTIELRGTYPMARGTIDSQKDILGGLRVDFLLGHRLRPYGDFLFGRGQMNYGSGYFYGNYEYDLTTTYVYSPGAGIDFKAGTHFAIKVDGQFQRWGSAPTPSGNVYSKVGTVALVYRFFSRSGVY